MGSYRVSRSASIAADPALVHRLVNDLHEWQAWSPWEGPDDHLERTYTGAEQGVGAVYAWSGSRRSGQGSMEITGSNHEQVDMVVTFAKPFAPTGAVSFELVAAGDRTDVTWVLTGEQKGVAALVGRVVSMDKLVGKDVEKGLARLKTAAEA